MNRHQTHRALFIAFLSILIADTTCHAGGSSCSAYEAQKSGTDVSIFTSSPYPWRVTSNPNGTLSIVNTTKHTSCSIELGSVLSVFFGKGNEIYLRSTEVMDDQLAVIDGLSCGTIQPMMPLEGSSEDAVQDQLRSLGLCSVPETQVSMR